MASDLAWQIGDGQRDGGKREALPDSECTAMVQRLMKSTNDGERIKLLKNLLVSYAVSDDQAVTLLEKVETSQGKVEAAVTLCSASSTSDEHVSRAKLVVSSALEGDLARVVRELFTCVRAGRQAPIS
jgi:hypothetical protein